MTTPSETAPLVPYEAFQHALGVLERLDERVARGRERCAWGVRCRTGGAAPSPGGRCGGVGMIPRNKF